MIKNSLKTSAISGFIILAGTLLAAGVLAFANFVGQPELTTASETTQWTQDVGAGIAAPACWSAESTAGCSGAAATISVTYSGIGDYAGSGCGGQGVRFYKDCTGSAVATSFSCPAVATGLESLTQYCFTIGGVHPDSGAFVRTPNCAGGGPNCGDGMCNTGAGETCSICPGDCGSCPAGRDPNFTFDGCSGGIAQFRNSQTGEVRNASEWQARGYDVQDQPQLCTSPGGGPDLRGRDGSIFFRGAGGVNYGDQNEADLNRVPPGTVVGFQGIVENIGDSSAGAFQNEFRIDGGGGAGGSSYDSNRHTSLSAGDFTNTQSPISGGWTATVGTHTIELCADTNFEVAEADEGNNCSAPQTFEVTAPTANLIATPPTIAPGQCTTLSWETTGTSDCSITDNDPNKPDIGNVPTNCDPAVDTCPKICLTKTTIFTLTCNPGPLTDNEVVRVLSIPDFREVPPR